MEPIENNDTINLKVVVAYCIATAVATAVGGVAASMTHSNLPGREPVQCYAIEQGQFLVDHAPPDGED